MVCIHQSMCLYMYMYMYILFFRGPHFRTCFQQIGGLRALTDVPIIALTATALHAIRISICSSLGLAVILDRPNIYLSTSKSRGVSVSSICA